MNKYFYSFSYSIIAIAMLFIFSCGGNKTNLGKVEFTEPIPDKNIKTEKFGEIASNQICVILKEDLKKSDAENIAKEFGGEVSGYMEFINLYQIKSDINSESDLINAVEKISGKDGVLQVFPNGAIELRGGGSSCNPLDDPVYKDLPDDYGDALSTSGLREAWDIISASGIKLNKVTAGIIDDNFGIRNSETNNNTNIKPIEPIRDTARGKHHHSNMIANIIGANPDNGGVTGYASILEEKLQINTSNLFHYGNRTEVEYKQDDFTQYKDKTGKSYTLSSLRMLQEQVESGAKIINCSYGPITLSNSTEPEAKAHRIFLEKLAKEHPDVLIVAAAPNGDGELNGKNDYWGHKLPNLITVGGVSNNGEMIVSPIVGGDAEITLSAPAGIVYDEGNCFGKSTSSCAPQITGAAILLKSINPKLTAAEIKKILTETAGKTVNGKPYPDKYGAGMLRIDDAVLKVINDIRKEEGLPPFSKESLLNLRKIILSSEGGPADYKVIANIPAVSEKGTEVSIEVTGSDYALSGDKIKKISSAGNVSWDITLKDLKSRITVTVKRLDTESCSYIVLGGTPLIYEIQGEWSGEIWYDEVVMDRRGFKSIIVDAFEELKGTKRSAILNVTKSGDETLKGRISYMVFGEEALTSAPSKEVIFNYIDGNLTTEFSYPGSGERITYEIKVSRTDSGFSCIGNWKSGKGAEYVSGIIELKKN